MPRFRELHLVALFALDARIIIARTDTRVAVGRLSLAFVERVITPFASAALCSELQFQMAAVGRLCCGGVVCRIERRRLERAGSTRVDDCESDQRRADRSDT